MAHKVIKWIAGTTAALLGSTALLIAAANAGWFTPSYEEVAAKHADAPSKFVRVGNVDVHVRDEGQGPVVLMLHSSMTNLRIYDEWADRLKQDYRVIRYDWSPYGLTRDTNEQRGMAGVVELLEKFIEQEQLNDITIVGSSSGAMASVLYTAKHPEKVKALALSTLPLAAPPPSEPAMFIQVMQYIHQNWMPNYLPRFYYTQMLKGLYGVPERLKSETVTWFYETNNIPGNFDRARAYYAANVKNLWSTNQGAEAAAKISKPILLQWGEMDHVLPKSRAGEAVQNFANADVTLIRYPDVSHYPMIEIPEKSGIDLKAYLDKIHKQPVAEVTADEKLQG